MLTDGAELDADLRAIRETYIEPGGAFFVGELDGEIVAMGAFKPVDSRTAEIKRMRVDPDHQRRGYGQRILDTLEATATEREFTTFVLDTTARQTGARRLYEKNGYRETRRKTVGEYEMLFYRKSIEERI
ncbi:GNAT family N-acetyltransferase [Halocatena marina]|uniref:GNAT family N-acetyltransferase n=2 Tax=Halocatena marina TaxID=2934937 RepID=A0ABD5YMS8_9EURY|nr:GNAT family N-acetyltransferase [Halocatena marina]